MRNLVFERAYVVLGLTLAKDIVYTIGAFSLYLCIMMSRIMVLYICCQCHGYVTSMTH